MENDFDILGEASSCDADGEIATGSDSLRYDNFYMVDFVGGKTVSDCYILLQGIYNTILLFFFAYVLFKTHDILSRVFKKHLH